MTDLTFKQFLRETEHDLEDLALELFFRRELQANKHQAHELAQWFTGEKDFRDIESESRDPILMRWRPDAVNLVKHPGMDYTDHVQDQVADLMRTYGLDPKDYIR